MFWDKFYHKHLYEKKMWKNVIIYICKRGNFAFEPIWSKNDISNYHKGVYIYENQSSTGNKKN